MGDYSTDYTVEDKDGKVLPLNARNEAAAKAHAKAAGYKLDTLKEVKK